MIIRNILLYCMIYVACQFVFLNLRRLMCFKQRRRGRFRGKEMTCQCLNYNCNSPRKQQRALEITNCCFKTASTATLERFLLFARVRIPLSQNVKNFPQHRTMTTVRITAPVMINGARSDIQMGSNEVSGVYKSPWQLSLNTSSLKVKSKNTPV